VWHHLTNPCWKCLSFLGYQVSESQHHCREPILLLHLSHHLSQHPTNIVKKLGDSDPSSKVDRESPALQSRKSERLSNLEEKEWLKVFSIFFRAREGSNKPDKEIQSGKAQESWLGEVVHSHHRYHSKQQRSLRSASTSLALEKGKGRHESARAENRGVYSKQRRLWCKLWGTMCSLCLHPLPTQEASTFLFSPHLSQVIDQVSGQNQDNRSLLRASSFHLAVLF
jgi:hypothetical protein